MTTRRGEIKYPPRKYKTVEEIIHSENQSLKKINPKLLEDIHPCVHASVDGSKIVEFFNGKSVFLTGATGFIGKLLVEKLLRSCKDIKHIYVLVRPKKGVDVQARVDKTFEDPLFSEIKKKVSDYRIKVVPIEGDISKPNLAMSWESRQKLIKNVNVIIHGAATVNLNAPLRESASINVSGTKEVMILAQQCEHLVSLVYISTAYCNCNNLEIREELYDHPYDGDEFLKFIESKTDEYLSENLKLIIGDWPNGYVFTKALAEKVVKNMAGNIPTSVCRPGTVVSTYREPLRGWIDNFYGAVGITVGLATGIIRVTWQDAKVTMDFIPGDIVSNGILAVAYQTQFNLQVSPSERTIKFYNFVSSQQNPISMGDFCYLGTYSGKQTPLSEAFWYVMWLPLTNHYSFHVMEFLLNCIPAVLLDCYLTLSGKKRRMFKLNQKIKTFLCVLSYFSIRDWRMYDENVKNLWKSLSAKDKEIFNFSMDPSNFNWNDFFLTYFLGVRLYIVKEEPSTIPAARKKYQRLFFIHVAFKTFIVFLLSTVAYFFLKRYIE